MKSANKKSDEIIDTLCVLFLAAAVIGAAAYLGEIVLTVVSSVFVLWLLWQEVRCTEHYRYPWRRTRCKECGDPISRRRQRLGREICMGCQYDLDEKHAQTEAYYRDPPPWRRDAKREDDHTVKPHRGWGPFWQNRDGLD